MKELSSARSFQWIQRVRVLCALVVITSASLHAQDGVLTLLQFDKGASRLKEAELAIARMTPCEVLGIDAGSVIRCRCPLGFTAAHNEPQQEKNAFRVVGSTQLHLDGSATFTGLAPFPVFHDSGDPVADDGRYTAWKSAWVAAFPDRYAARVLNPLETTVR
jgi:hypothetical protein